MVTTVMVTVSRCRSRTSEKGSRFAAVGGAGRIIIHEADLKDCEIALVRKSWLFVGSKRGADPLAWLANVLARIADIPRTRLHELLPWEWKQLNLQAAA